MKRLLFIHFLMAVLTLRMNIADYISTRIIVTKYGRLKGFVKEMQNTSLGPVEVFLGIPYATPPVLDLRFVPPVTPPPWDGVKINDHYKPACMQTFPNIENETEALLSMSKKAFLYLKHIRSQLQHQSEDCLYLNIYVPLGGESQVIRRSHPIMVYIHGGGFEWNSGNLYDGSILSSYASVIVVTINYRLGRLGFLNINHKEDTKIVSNIGLMDQIAALHWIQENIAEFGGDKSNVTLFGHEAGAACIHFLMLSSAVPAGLFQRAILMSGSAFSPWATVDQPLLYTLKLSQILNCSLPESTESVTSCLRKIPVNALMKPKLSGPKFFFVFGPSVDGIVIKKNYRDSWREETGEHALNRYDVLVGVTEFDAYHYFGESDLIHGFSELRRNAILRAFVKNAYSFHRREIFAAIANEYTDWQANGKNPIDIRDNTLNALGDSLFVTPAVATANFYAKHSNVYFYVFAQDLGVDPFNRNPGAVHGDEVPILFGEYLVNPSLTKNSEEAVQFSEIVMKFWTNFAKMGNPNYSSNVESTVPHDGGKKNRSNELSMWFLYDSSAQKYLHLSLKYAMQTHYRAHKLSLWLNLIPEMLKAGKDTKAYPESVRDQEEISDGYMASICKVGYTEPSILSKLVAKTGQLHPQPTSEISTVTRTEEIVKTRIQPSLVQLFPYSPATNDAKTDGGARTYAVQNSFTFAVTVGIGCCLLVLNVLIFIGVFYRRCRFASENCSSETKKTRNSSKMLHCDLEAAVGSKPIPNSYRTCSPRGESARASTAGLPYVVAETPPDKNIPAYPQRNLSVLPALPTSYFLTVGSAHVKRNASSECAVYKELTV